MNYSKLLIAALGCVANVFATTFATSESAVRSDYTVWCTGNCEHDVSTDSSPGSVLMGGGTDTNEAFAWQISNANGGDFVVMRASGDEAYNDYIFEMSVAINSRLNSVRTILFKSASASVESEVLEIIKNAEAIFFAGNSMIIGEVVMKVTGM